MNRFQLAKFRKKCHTWSEHVESFNLCAMPTKLKNAFPKEEYELFTALPFVRIEDINIILVNESFEEWQCMKNIFVALDTLPDSLLADIYQRDSKQYKGVDISNTMGEDSDDTLRRIIFVLIPDILWAHGKPI